MSHIAIKLYTKSNELMTFHYAFLTIDFKTLLLAILACDGGKLVSITLQLPFPVWVGVVEDVIERQLMPTAYTIGIVFIFSVGIKWLSFLNKWTPYRFVHVIPSDVTGKFKWEIIDSICHRDHLLLTMRGNMCTLNKASQTRVQACWISGHGLLRYVHVSRYSNLSAPCYRHTSLLSNCFLLVEI